MSEVAAAFVTVAPSMKGFGSSVIREATVTGNKAGQTAGAGFGRFFTKATIGPLRTFGELAVGIFAAEKIKDFFGAAIGKARESQKVSALTAQVIKTTGGAAEISAKQVGDLATAISNKVGIDVKAIQSGENLLLTFKDIRNEVGAGNDIFTQTTKVMTDMSAALGTDMKSSAIQLGKALNDPIRGLTALQRVGVSFTEQQKAQIKAMVESGDVIGAQKIILAELTSEFGGAAAASATMGDKAGVAFHNMEEAIGTRLIPVVDGLEVAFVGTISGISRAVGWLEKHKTADLVVAGALTGALIPALARTAFAMSSKVWYDFSLLMGRVRTAVAALTATEAAAAVETTLLSRATAAAGAVLGLASVRWGLAGAAVALSYYEMKKGSDAAKGSADDFVNSLHVNTASLSSLQQGMQAIKAEIYDVAAGSNTQAVAIGGELTKAYQELQTKAQTLTATQHALSAAMHMSGDDVAALAAKYGIGLTEGTAKALPQLEAVRRSIFLSHHPALQAAADLSNLGNKANTLSDDLGLLDTRWNNLIGNFVGMKVAEAQARDSIVELSKALGKSKTGFDLNTASGRKAIEQLGSTTDSLDAVAQAVFKQTGSYTKTEAVMSHMVKRMTADLPKGSAVAKRVTAQIEKYLQGLTDKAHGEGEDTGRGYGQGLYQGILSQLGPVTHASQMLAAQIDKHVRLDIQAHSPSLKGFASGADYGRGVVAGLDSMNDSAGAAGTRLADSFAGATKAELDKRLADMKDKLSGARSDRGNLASSLTASLTGFDLSGAADAQGKFSGAGIASFLDDFLAREEQVLKLAHRLEKKGVPASFITKIEQESPDQALSILRALSQATPKELRDIRGDLSDINVFGKQGGRAQSREVHDPQIKRLEAQLAALRHDVRQIGGDVAHAMNGSTANAKRKGTARAAS